MCEHAARGCIEPQESVRLLLGRGEGSPAMADGVHAIFVWLWCEEQDPDGQCHKNPTWQPLCMTEGCLYLPTGKVGGGRTCGPA